jgi:DNA-binding NtrC family response regulator
VRELRNAVARWHALGDMAFDVSRDAPNRGAPPGEYMDEVVAMKVPLLRARQLVVNEFERRYIAAVLDEHGGNVGRAAAASGIARRYFQIIRARGR